MKHLDYVKGGMMLLLCSLFIACNKLEYSPYQTKPVGNGQMPLGLNAANISRLLSSSPSDDTVTFLFAGDSQRFYDELEDLVTLCNGLPHLDFFILSGDITDFGLLQEFTWVQDRLAQLRVPYFCAIGNHDLTGQGERIYSQMFGEKNFSFLYKRYKFLFHDTNGREYDFDGSTPHIGWLSAELKDAEAKWFVGVSHVPPYDSDFDKQLEAPYSQLFGSTSGFFLSLHGHLHTVLDAYPYADSVRYMTCNAIDSRQATLLQLVNGNISKYTLLY